MSEVHVFLPQGVKSKPRQRTILTRSNGMMEDHASMLWDQSLNMTEQMHDKSRQLTQCRNLSTTQHGGSL